MEKKGKPAANPESGDQVSIENPGRLIYLYSQVIVMSHISCQRFFLIIYGILLLPSMLIYSS